MAAAADKTKKSADKEKAAAPRSRLLVFGLIALIAAGAAGGGVWYFTSAGHPAEAEANAAPAKKAPPAPAQYFALEPAFVVNLNGSMDGPRYLQVEIQLMTRDPAALEAIKTHAPAIRARLLMLLSQVTAEEIADLAGKQKLQAAALAEVQKVLVTETGKPGADELLFTSFVTQ
ncbi:flagellar basal body-associated FliL family protein [Xanthomonas sp. 60]